jgi:hypothetical protein
MILVRMGQDLSNDVDASCVCDEYVGWLIVWLVIVTCNAEVKLCISLAAVSTTRLTG